MSGLFHQADDPDWSSSLYLQMGAPLRVGVAMTRNPAVLEERVKWDLPEPESEGVAEPLNYVSVGRCVAEGAKLFMSEEALRWMADEACRMHGDRVAFVSVASVVVVQEPGQIRVMHDGPC